MKISILTLFPEMFTGPFDYSIIKNAIKKGLVEITFINIRDFGIGKHKRVDDKPYGGGKGMILRADVLEKAIGKAKIVGCAKQKVVLLDPAGKTFNQKKAIKFSKLSHLIFVCGHYEGVDERTKKFVDEVTSIGDFVATGGEIPTMLIVDSIVRLIKNVLPKNVVDEESFSNNVNGKKYLEYPQYTRPEKFKKLAVPKILLSGNHNAIKKWREEKAVTKTARCRPDLMGLHD